ncbi:glycosyltransferase [Bacteroidota bacterium]
MRICYLADGESIHTKRWCTHFRDLGHDIHLISFKNVNIDGVNVHFVDAGKIKVSGGNWQVVFKVLYIKKLLKEISPDILHAQYATSYGFAGALTNFHPFVVTTLGTDVLISPKTSFAYKIVLKHVFKKAEWITVMADHMKDIILELKASPDKLTTIIFGIDPNIFNHSKRKLPNDHFVITSTRNFEPVYNIPLLIKGFKYLENKIPGIQLNLIGDGSLRGDLEKMVMELGLSKLVSFHGRLPQWRIVEILNQSHIFATTSLSDGNNISLNEAMACGAISIATDIPANRAWIKEGVNGFIIPTDNPKYLAEKIIEIFQNYDQYERSAIPYNDKIIEDKAHWSKNMEKVEKKYNDLIALDY